MAELHPSDDALMASLAARDLGALASLYDRYGRLAYSLAYRILGESEAAEDVVQDAFLSAWRGAASYRRGRGQPPAPPPPPPPPPPPAPLPPPTTLPPPPPRAAPPRPPPPHPPRQGPGGGERKS